MTDQADRTLSRLAPVGAVLCLAAAVMAARFASPVTPGETQARNAWIDLGNGVLQDGRTGLQWIQAELGRDMDRDGAQSYCAAKKDGWRLPDPKELSAIDAADAKNRLFGGGAYASRVLCVRERQ